MLYAMLLVSGVSLVTLVVGDVISAVESEEGELHHLFIFDLAWPIFILIGLLALSTGIGALVGGAMRRNPRAARYGAWAVGYCALAVVVVMVSEALGP